MKQATLTRRGRIYLRMDTEVVGAKRSVSYRITLLTAAIAVWAGVVLAIGWGA